MLLSFLANSVFAQCDIPAPEKSVWGTQFENGLDGWSALDGDFNERKRADGSDIGWEWSMDGSVAAGNFSIGTLQSPSICNGAMVLNSDFLDNEGMDDNFGNGDCPATCNSILLSPTIDLSEQDGNDFVLQFASRHRHFNSEYNILLSNDDGVTWFDTIAVFGGSDYETVRNEPAIGLDQYRIPLCQLQNDRDVRIAFWYNANYYHWAIDDVYLIAEDEPDLRVNENWYAKSLTLGIPYDQAYPLAFLADIENRSPVSSESSTLRLAVTNDSGNEVHSQTLAYNEVDGCNLDENKTFLEMYSPTDISPGDVWRVRYTINDDNSDADNSNNTTGSRIEWTENLWKSVNTEEDIGRNYLVGWKYAGEHLNESWGRHFYVANGTRDGIQLHLGQVDFGFFVGNGGDANQVSIVVSVYEWVDSNNNGLVDADPSDEKIKLGSAPTIFGGILENTRSITVFPVDEDGEMIELKDSTHYIVMVHYQSFTASTRIFPLMAPTGLHGYAHAPAELAYETFFDDNTTGVDLSALVGQLGGIGVTAQDADRERQFNRNNFSYLFTNIHLDFFNSAQELNENIGINIYPNPAEDYVSADLLLDEISKNVQVEIIDVTGKTIKSKRLQNIKEQKITLSTEGLYNGLYIMNIRTDKGMNSQKFNILNRK